ncbi:hypothetical protein pdam_00014876 [Pocillopora damicornis]|uniref:Uncharacterized protein n=1 Tax=Pocillopora damicornis TaxID=46731 RepID=A0A3M6THQ6_POCDA|nr:hypothetical protein pdam_00014876 [Pocillopora damicornis]
MLPIREAASQDNNFAPERDKPTTHQEATFKQIQRASTLPSQELPVFKGSYFDYPTFIAAFNVMIEKKVDSEKDKLYFSSKYTSGKAHEVVKGFLTWDSDKGYEEASYKAKLQNWPQIVEGDSSGLQDLSDFRVRSERAMQSMKYMADLNSTRLPQEISTKLLLKSGSRWCCQARKERTVSFHNLEEFFKEADLANDPVFSPEVMKSNKNKAPDRKQVKRSQGANSFASFSTRTLPSESRGRPNAKQEPKQKVCVSSAAVTTHLTSVEN